MDWGKCALSLFPALSYILFLFLDKTRERKIELL
jgi:hypothetical protein